MKTCILLILPFLVFCSSSYGQKIHIDRSDSTFFMNFISMKAVYEDTKSAVIMTNGINHLSKRDFNLIVNFKQKDTLPFTVAQDSSVSLVLDNGNLVKLKLWRPQPKTVYRKGGSSLFLQFYVSASTAMQLAKRNLAQIKLHGTANKDAVYAISKVNQGTLKNCFARFDQWLTVYDLYKNKKISEADFLVAKKKYVD